MQTLLYDLYIAKVEDPLGEIQKNVEKLELHLPIVFYCKRGIRSQIAIQRLSKRIDTANFYNLHKGILHLMPV